MVMRPVMELMEVVGKSRVGIDSRNNIGVMAMPSASLGSVIERTV